MHPSLLNFDDILITFLFLDKLLLQTVSNHPVHILNDLGKYSPSSFIPFCYLGEQFIGARINDFEIPVCNILRPTNFFDQLCYETNLQDLKASPKQLEMGLTLVLDYNEERQYYNRIEQSEVSLNIDTIS